MSDLLGVGSTIGAIGDIVVGQQNYDMQQQNLQYQKDLQTKMFDREDNSIQRRVADLKAAGLSPVLAAGQGANAGPVVTTQAPQLNMGSLQGKIANIGDAIATQQQIKKDNVMIAQTNAQTALIQQQTEMARASMPLNLEKLGLSNKLQNIVIDYNDRTLNTRVDLQTAKLQAQETENTYRQLTQSARVQEALGRLTEQENRIVIQGLNQQLQKAGISMADLKIIEQSMQNEYQRQTLPQGIVRGQQEIDARIVALQIAKAALAKTTSEAASAKARAIEDTLNATYWQSAGLSPAAIENLFRALELVGGTLGNAKNLLSGMTR